MAICNTKKFTQHQTHIFYRGKVENIYIGDGLKFSGRTYSPDIPEETATEYIQGPELMEVVDPTVEMEQKWLKKLEVHIQGFPC